ncbi:hypothetical protein FD754_014663 [Muntiacus muntjak]|uniref:Uncharacterized protein n=1 Tax=Muntiacus muntjak TaxID=9888 RepID=A0A5N3VP38_MUNMU|nr:hypothetical protein FD754_014663 [Muntiacus muntjak]
MSDMAVANTQTLNLKLQELTNVYSLPNNFLEINIFNPQTVGICMWTKLPVFKLKESCIVLIVPPLHGKALKWQLPFQGNKRSLLAELLINWMDAGHPLAQNERCLHMFL